MVAEFVIARNKDLVAKAHWTNCERLKTMRDEAYKCFNLKMLRKFTPIKVFNRLSDFYNLGKYSTLRNNCQETMKKLLESLRVRMPEELKTLQEAIDELGPNLFEGDE